MTAVGLELFVPMFQVMAETVVPTSCSEDQLEIILMSFRAGGSASEGHRPSVTWLLGRSCECDAVGKGDARGPM